MLRGEVEGFCVRRLDVLRVHAEVGCGDVVLEAGCERCAEAIFQRYTVGGAVAGYAAGAGEVGVEEEGGVLSEVGIEADALDSSEEESEASTNDGGVQKRVGQSEGRRDGGLLRVGGRVVSV